MSEEFTEIENAFAGAIGRARDDLRAGAEDARDAIERQRRAQAILDALVTLGRKCKIPNRTLGGAP